MSEGLTASIRRRTRSAMATSDACPHCGRAEEYMGLREAAKESGVSAATLSRFLNGEQVQSDVLDKIVLWIETEEAKKQNAK